jgi:hypothetical protein
VDLAKSRDVDSARQASCQATPRHSAGSRGGVLRPTPAPLSAMRISADHCASSLAPAQFAATSLVLIASLASPAAASSGPCRSIFQAWPKRRILASPFCLSPLVIPSPFLPVSLTIFAIHLYPITLAAFLPLCLVAGRFFSTLGPHHVRSAGAIALPWYQPPWLR